MDEQICLNFPSVQQVRIISINLSFKINLLTYNAWKIIVSQYILSSETATSPLVETCSDEGHRMNIEGHTQNFQMEGDKLAANNFDLMMFVNKTWYFFNYQSCHMEKHFSVPPSLTAANPQCCWHMRPPWIITEDQKEQGGPISRGRAPLAHQRHWSRPVHATSMVTSASHILGFTVRWNAS